MPHLQSSLSKNTFSIKHYIACHIASVIVNIISVKINSCSVSDCMAKEICLVSNCTIFPKINLKNLNYLKGFQFIPVSNLYKNNLRQFHCFIIRFAGYLTLPGPNFPKSLN